MVRIVNLILLCLALAGAGMAWRASSAHSDAQAENRRLTRLLGPFPIEDETNIHVQDQTTDAPLDFAWRVFIPENLPLSVLTRTEHGRGRTSGSLSHAIHGIFRARFRKIDGQWHVWTDGPGMSGYRGLSNAEVLDSPEQLDIRVAGRGQLEVHDPSQAVELLRIGRPDASAPNARAPVLFSLCIGSRAAIDALEAAEN